MKKKVLFLIFATDTAAGGGHYYSLITIVKALSDKIDFKILNIGLTFVNILEKSDLSVDYLPTRKENFVQDIRSVRRYVNDYNPDIIHAFDLNALRIARSLFLKGKPIVFNKCGGVNNSLLIPNSDAYVCFSKENSNFIKKRKKNNSPVYLIPNRVNRVSIDQERIDNLRKEYNLVDKEIFLRISRINEMHKHSILQAINLFKASRAASEKSSLLLIGVVQNEKTLKEIESAIQDIPNVYIITDPIYCLNAAELINVADVIIGTGRGAMESASLGKPVFCPVKDVDLPVPLCEDTFDQLMFYNFSGRTQGISLTEEETLNYLTNRRQELGEYAYECFSLFFDVESGIQHYLEIYANVKSGNKGIANAINYLMDMGSFFKPRGIGRLLKRFRK